MGIKRTEQTASGLAARPRCVAQVPTFGVQVGTACVYINISQTRRLYSLSLSPIVQRRHARHTTGLEAFFVEKKSKENITKNLALNRKICGPGL